MTLYDSDIVHAYGGAHISMPYYDAEDMAIDFKEGGSELLLVRVSDDGFELVCFDDDYRMDSEYITLEAGRELRRRGLVGVLACWTGPEDEPKTEEAFARLQYEQVFE